MSKAYLPRRPEFRADFDQQKAPSALSEELRGIWDTTAPEVRLIAQRFERAGFGTWDNRRVATLCKSLRWTIWMLCAQCGYFRMQLDRRSDVMRFTLDVVAIREHWHDNHWPVVLASQFDRLEQYDRVRRKLPGATLTNQADESAATLFAASPKG